MDNYEKLVDKISKHAGITADDVLRKIEAKRAKLSGLVSKEGAAQIVASELGINFDKERLKIAELLQGMKRANVVGKVIEVFPILEYNKNGRAGKVGRFVLADEGSNAKVLLWDTNHISLLENGKIKQGDVIEISNGNVRNGEIHLSSFGDIKISNEKMGEVVVAKVFPKKKIKDAKVGERFKTRAVIVQTFEPRYFEVCPECRKKIIEGECANHGKVTSEKRALLNLVLDDGSETVRSVIFGEQINKLGLNEEEIFSIEKFNGRKESLLGEEKMFVGNMRSNNLYNTSEFNIESIEEVNVDELIKELEAK